VTEAVFLTVLVLVWIAVLSSAVLALGGVALARRTARSPAREPSSWPGISILVPARDEEAVIGRSLRRFLELDYPADRLQIVVVDDASTDATGEICDRLAQADSRVTVLHVPSASGGTGKAAALNRALPLCRYELVAVYDADTLPRPDALRRLVSALDDEHVAAVGRLLKVDRGGSLLRRLAALEFSTFQWAFQAGRKRFFDVVLLTGTNYLVRAKTLRELGGWDVRALTEDLELSVRLACRGRRTTLALDAVAEEHDPTSLRVWARQRTRWVLGNYYVLLTRGGAILRSGHGRALVLLWELIWLYAVFLVAAVVSEVIFLGGLLGLVDVAVDGRFLILWLLAFFLFLAVVQVAAALDGGDSWRTPLLGTVMYFVYCPLWLYVLGRALVVYVARRGDLQWSKTPHTAS
jgi:cellulose synthase/poly-beta-1,6-N-acetylglucosamine synthase-like glycosyltransferase